MAASIIQRCRCALQIFEANLAQILGRNGPFGPNCPALAAAAGPSLPAQSSDHAPSDARSVIESIFDGFAWMPVGAFPQKGPTHRRSAERNMKRKLGSVQVKKYMTPRHDLFACPECGHYFVGGYICGNCYNKVVKETEEMKAAMNENDRLFNAPQREVRYVYEGETEGPDQRKSVDGKYIVEMPKKRPEWWSNNMLVKAFSEKS